MIRQKKTIESIKRQIHDFYLKDVNVKVNLGRNKTVSYQGKLTAIYPYLVTVSPYGHYMGNTNFSYADILCGTVEITETKTG